MNFEGYHGNPSKVDAHVAVGWWGSGGCWPPPLDEAVFVSYANPNLPQSGVKAPPPSRPPSPQLVTTELRELHRTSSASPDTPSSGGDGEAFV